MNVSDWEREIEAAFKSQGKEYTPALRELMHSGPSDEKVLEAVEVTNTMQRYFWKKVLSGEPFGDVNRVNEKFGKSLEENYGLSSGPFMDVAKVYWTYQIEVGDLFPEYSDKWISQALKGVEIKIRELFFPTPGPMQVPVDTRRSAQKEYLEQFAPQLDIERFLNENPILQSNAEVQAGAKSGCLGAVAVFAILITATIIYVGWV